MKILVLHAPAGYGHVKAAEVIEKALCASGVHAILRNALDFAPGWFRKSYPASYFHSVKKTPWLWGALYEILDSPFIYSLFKPFREIGNSLVGGKLLKLVEVENPDVIISTHFFSAELLARAKEKKRLNAELVTVVTDFHPHSFWINHGTDDYWVMNEEGRLRLLERDVADEQIHVKGIPVGSEFSESSMSKADLQEKYELDQKKLTILISGGSFGLGDKAELLRRLESEFPDQIQCLVVCGHNDDLYQELSMMNFSIPARIFGFIDFMSELMRVSDLVVAKPGGLTTSECLSLGVAMVVHHAIPGQETRNADVLRKHDAAFFMEEAEDLVELIARVLRTPSELKTVQGNARKMGKPFASRELVKFVKEEIKLRENI